MSVDYQDQEHRPYTPDDPDLFASIDSLFQGKTLKEDVPNENKFSIGTKELLGKLGFVFLPVGGKSIDDLIKEGIPLDILQAHRNYSPRSWGKVLPLREVAVNRNPQFQLFPPINGSHDRLVEEVARYNRDAVHHQVRDEIIATLGLPVTVIQGFLAFEERYEIPLRSEVRVSTEVTYPGSDGNFVLDIEYEDKGIGQPKQFTTTGRKVSESALRRGLIIFEKRSVLKSFSTAT